MAEVFAYGPRPGSDQWAVLQDTCVLISKQIQDGTNHKTFATKAVRDESGNPQSMVGVVADVLNEYD